MEPQCVLMMPLLVGLDGVVKMSKSKGNYIGVTEPPSEMFGKIMSISDSLMWNYFTLLSEKSNEGLERLKSACLNGSMNPRDAKIELGREMVARFHGEEKAKEAVEGFLNQFQKGAIPENIPEFSIEAKPVANILKEAGLVASTSDGLRMIKQGAVKINGKAVSSKDEKVVPGTAVWQVGKRRFARITVK